MRRRIHTGHDVLTSRLNLIGVQSGRGEKSGWPWRTGPRCDYKSTIAERSGTTCSIPRRLYADPKWVKLVPEARIIIPSVEKVGEKRFFV